MAAADEIFGGGPAKPKADPSRAGQIVDNWLYGADGTPTVNYAQNPRGAGGPDDFHWTPSWQQQQGDPNYDAATQSFKPERGYVMGGYADGKPTDAQGNGIDPLTDPDNTAWGNGESYNQHVADIENRQQASAQYNSDQDARYEREMSTWNAAHPGSGGAPTPPAPAAHPYDAAPAPDADQALNDYIDSGASPTGDYSAPGAGPSSPAAGPTSPSSFMSGGGSGGVAGGAYQGWKKQHAGQFGVDSPSNQIFGKGGF